MAHHGEPAGAVRPQTPFLGLVAAAWLLAAAAPLRCAIVTAPPDWNDAALHGDLSRLAINFCRAIARAATGKPDPELHPFPTEREALSALEHGTVDAAVGLTRPARSATPGISWSAPIFNDTFAILARDESGIETLSDLRGRRFCTLDGTEPAAAIAGAIAAQHIRPMNFPFQEQGEMQSALAAGRCEAAGAPLSLLQNIRPSGTHFLKEHVGSVAVRIATRSDDPRLSVIVESVAVERK